MLIVLKGISGSGKTTLRKQIVDFLYQKVGISIYCPDDLLIDKDTGKYVWTPQRANYAHKTTEFQFDEFITNIAQSYSNPKHFALILDKQNVKWSDCKYYVDLAENCGHDIVFVETDTEWKFDENVLFQKNEHNVPLDTIGRNIKDWQKQSHFEYVFHSKYGYKPHYCVGFEQFKSVWDNIYL